jgi:L-asparaginase
LPPTSRLRVHTELNTSVVVLRLAPGFDDGAIEAMVQHAHNLRGIVLSLYGTGSARRPKRNLTQP